MRNISLELGKRIKQVRVSKGLTQQQLSEKADISISFLSVIERGQKSPTVETLQKISIALDITLSELFSFDEEKSSSKSAQVHSLLAEYTNKIESIYKK